MIKTLLLWIFYAFLGLIVFLWGANAFNTHRVRYRITVDVETPSGVKSGSSIIEVLTWNSVYLPVIRYSVEESVRGEAAFVDLGDGKNLIALLASGPKAEGVDWARYVREAFKRPEVSDSWTVLSATRASMVLPPERQPTLVTFTDLANPASARVVAATEQGFEASFGAGYRLRAITMTYVDPGLRLMHIWPLNRLPAPWPQWLFGTPITRGIEARLPFLVTHRERLWKQRTGPSDPYIPQWHNFLRGL